MNDWSRQETEMSELLESILAHAMEVGVRKRPRRSCRRPAGWTPTPRRDRVFKTCVRCGESNHIRRLFCSKCFTSRADMNISASGRSAFLK